ncbi:CD276 antigen homolog, partial [Notothenia coriiceps]|uniref:CD276 antigen homolog n=1 Tax=Notothenia coriiceps TaxID=8208 RepID=A0A6I9PSN4_9TELE
MIIVSVAYFLLLVSDATGILRVNTTVGKSTILPCLLNTNITDLHNLRFYWQDENKKVLYSFDKGTEVPEYVDRLYRGRITAFHQDMRIGHVSIKLENTTMEDNQKVFDVFAKVFESGGTTNRICQLTLHVDAPNEIQATICPSNR